jgi:large subunit ribosomal protein L23
MNANQIIRRPLVTEKSTVLRESSNVIAFEVDPKANKIQVKNAVEELFKDVKVEEVRIFNVRGKVKRMGRYAGKRRDWRKAYVRLKEGSKVPDFIEGGV